MQNGMNLHDFIDAHIIEAQRQAKACDEGNDLKSKGRFKIHGSRNNKVLGISDFFPDTLEAEEKERTTP